MEAARLVASGQSIELDSDGEAPRAELDEAFIAEARAMGVDPESFGSVATRDGDSEVFVLWPENVEAFDLFCALSTQWTWIFSDIAGAQRVGLNHSRIELHLRIQGVRGSRKRAIFSDVCLMERAALAKFKEAASG